MTADDTTAVLADTAEEPPLNGGIKLPGPESLTIAAFVGRHLATSGDTRTAVADPQTRCQGGRP